MFLFRREGSPLFGLFILNRNGLEYIQELLSFQSEVKLEGEFILFEPRPDAGKQQPFTALNSCLAHSSPCRPCNWDLGSRQIRA